MFMIERLLAIRGQLSDVLEQLGWDNLATSEWKVLSYIHDLLKPFAMYTSLVSGEEYTTISSVIPIIMELNLHLKEMKKVPEVCEAAKTLLGELKQFTDPINSDHDPIFLVCALVDPRYKVLLNPTQKESAKCELLKYLKDQSESDSDDTSTPHSPSTCDPMDERESHPISIFVTSTSSETEA